MNGLPYYKAYPRDFIEGTAGMDFEVKAAYRLILDFIYMQNGCLPDDPRYIAGLMGCSVKKWNSLRQRLFDAGKIELRNGFLGNLRADKELEISGKFQGKQSENRSTPNKNKGLQSPRSHHTDTDTDINTTLSSVVNARPMNDLDGLQDKLVNAIGDGNIQGYAAIVTGPIVELITSGVDLDVDILPTLKSMASRLKHPARSWSYFVPAIREAYERRLAASSNLPKPIGDFKAGLMMRGPDGKFVATTEARWRQRLESWRKNGAWTMAEWGPRPGEDGCTAPKHLLEEARVAA